MPHTHDLQTKLKRQIEILGLCSDPKSRFRIADLSELFECEDLTIKRDLQDLRSAGIDIHSVAGKGISIEGGLDSLRTQELILQYSVLSLSKGSDKATKVLVQKQGALALRNMVILQRCIDHSLVARIDYEKTAGKVSQGREVGPARIFRADHQWRLIGENEGLLKQFLISKMTSVEMMDRSFKPIQQEEINALFLYSFRSFLGTDKLRVRLLLSNRWAEIIKPRQLFEEAEVTERSDRSIEIILFVNNLEEIAGWVASRGKGVAVLEPLKLREMVIDLARGVLENYDDESAKQNSRTIV